MSPPVTIQPSPHSPGKTEMRWLSRSLSDGEQGIPGGKGQGRIYDGFEALQHTDKVVVQQTIETVGASCDVTNTYSLTDKESEQLFLAIEDASCCGRFCCGPARPLRLVLRDRRGNDVVHFVRPPRCDACCCPCCMMGIMVQTPGGEIIGYVKQTWSLFGAAFKIEDADKTPLMTLWTSCCPCRCETDLEIQVWKISDGRSGLIRKQWGGRKQDINMDHETFIIEFPPECDTESKILLIGAAFLMDFMFFEMT
ncbi:phospholipid scramblase 3-like [Acanthaster planci]|uniref:Phospholipid scramblase n=1 Tax=Acanthaster planci TaxID=133434 RepID=A0A8B7Y4M6_ACAPL|nr:phospholipid scramblase 3-like [Acanthaster planci]